MPAKEQEKVIVDRPDGLLEVRVNLPQYGSHTDRWFGGGDVRKALREDFDPKATYVFVTTVANPAAREAVKKNFDTGDPDSVRTRFDAEVNDIYLSAVEHLAKKTGLAHASYPLVKNDGVHDLDRHHDQPDWPVVHVLRVRGGTAGMDRSQLDGIIRNLHDGAAYEHIRRKQAPQNYYMHIIDFLREQRISPLMPQRTWVIEGRELKQAADFLLQFEYGERWTGPVTDVDD